MAVQFNKLSIRLHPGLIFNNYADEECLKQLTDHLFVFL